MPSTAAARDGVNGTGVQSAEDFSTRPQRTTPLGSLRRRVLSIDFEEEAKPPCTPPSAAEQPSPAHLDWWERRLDDLLLITRLAFVLYGYLWSGVRWYFKFLRLLAFSLLLLPGFSQMVAFYFFSPRMQRSVPYGTKPRNRLDVYLPRRRWRRRGPRPVVIYVTGGAWTIGYKAWGALFGRRLSQRGVLVFCLDYRNFPQGSAMDMLQDVNTGIAWCLQNLHLYGGDPDSVYVVGQSAGGHLTALALLAQARQAAAAGAAVLGGSPAWDVAQIQGFVGVSGAYDLITLADYLHHRGLYRNLFESIMAGPDGRPMLTELSPSFVAATELCPAAAKLLPPTLLLHGTADRSVPITNAEGFAAALRAAGVRDCRLKAYAGKTHTQPIIEDPMRGGQDELMDEVLNFVVQGGGPAAVNIQFPMLPSVLIDAATWICPF